MKIVSRAARMQEWKASSKAQEVFDTLQTVDQEQLKKIAALLNSAVSGISGSSYKEICYSILYVAEGKTPHWLGGTELPESVPAASTRQVTVEAPAATVKADWETFLNL